MSEVRRTESNMSRRQFLEVSAASLAAFCLMDNRCAGKNANADAASGISTGQTLTDLYREAAQVLFQARPLTATAFGLSEEDAGQRYANLVDDYSPESEALLRKELFHLSSRIRDCDLTSATQADKEIREVMEAITRFYSGHPDFSIGYIDLFTGLSPFIVNQYWCPVQDAPFNMSSCSNIQSEQDASDYIERLDKFDRMISSIQRKLRADSDKNWIPPKVCLDGALSYLQKFIKPSPAQHTLAVTFAKKLEAVGNISEEKKKALVEHASRKVAEVVYPAYQLLAKQTQSLLKNARDESGIWAQPNGEKFYQDAIRQLGGSELSADQIHQLGLSEVERITVQMDELLRSQHYESGSVAERMVMLSKEPRFLYPDSEEGHSMLLDDLRSYYLEVTSKMGALFKTQSPFTVEIRRVPVETQENEAQGYYMPPPADGSRPGVFYINLRDMKAHPKFSLKTLLYHELNPGHHNQITLGMMRKDVPFLMTSTFFPGFTEGWAMYCEKLAKEMGLYENDPFGNLGRLQSELWRATRLVVDTGLHYKRWTREKTIKYLSEITGFPEFVSTSEVERYMALPAQALSYKLGMLKMLGLRDRAKKELGQRFDLAEFHDVILLGGAMPLQLLEKRVDNWIIANRQA